MTILTCGYKVRICFSSSDLFIDIVILCPVELASDFLTSSQAPARDSADSDTESMDSTRSPRNAYWADGNENEDDEENALGTPTRGRRRGNGGSSSRITGPRVNGDGTPNHFGRGVIPMPSPALLFSGHQTPTSVNAATASLRPPDSMGSVFGGAGRGVPGVIGGGGLTSALGLGAEYAEFEGGVAGAMESGAGSAVNISLFREFAAMHGGGGGTGRERENGRHEHGYGNDENEDVRMAGINPAENVDPRVRPNAEATKSRRFFKSSGIRLRGTNDVTFPLTALNGPATGSSWGPAGFGGFGNEDHVMKRGFGLVYGGYGQGGVGAAGLEAAEEEEGGAGADAGFTAATAAAAATTTAGSGRRGRFRRAAEEMEVDGAEESD